jgi:GntR family transcriptional regulator
VHPRDLDLSHYDHATNTSWSALPMRVQVYEQVSVWIDSGQLPPSSQLPTEAELGDIFGVSRTVIREALILLEEDGVVVRRRGVGRFVATHRPELGLEQLRPMERLLPEALVTRLESSHERPTHLVEQNLAVQPDGDVLRWESLLTTDDGPVCLSEEWIAWPPPVSGAAGRLLIASLEADATPAATMAALTWDCCGAAIGPSVCRITVTTAEARRADLLGVDVGSPLLAIVQVTQHLGKPLLCHKHLLRTDRTPLVVQQRRGGGADS